MMKQGKKEKDNQPNRNNFYNGVKRGKDLIQYLYISPDKNCQICVGVEIFAAIGGEELCQTLLVHTLWHLISQGAEGESSKQKILEKMASPPRAFANQTSITKVSPRSSVGKEPLKCAYMNLVLLLTMKSLFSWLPCTHTHTHTNSLNTLTTI